MVTDKPDPANDDPSQADRAAKDPAETPSTPPRALDSEDETIDEPSLPASAGAAGTQSEYWDMGTGTWQALVGSSHPERVGPYQIEEVLGEGGMGVVYRATQTEPVRRDVALKLIKQGMDTREVVARFESERQALALMTHPNIAKVYDAGSTEQGRPYFVMEYVPATPITRYADEKSLDLRQRLEVFIQVCEAIQHAHQKAIIHRDLKPSNVLVTDQDGTPIPKIIDFGIAKATGQSLTDKTLMTAQGQVIGTPEYMSPEQAGLEEDDVDTRTDIYSLGVLLYELLTGVLPFDSRRLRQAGYLGILQIIREEVPVRPSTRLRQSTATKTGDSGPSYHLAQRMIKQIKGDLDWITLKALEKERSRRYDSASELAADVSRFLRYEPVLARPPSTVYRLQKFLRRHAEKVVAAGLIVFVVAALLVYDRYNSTVKAKAALDTGKKSSEEVAKLIPQKEAVERRYQRIKRIKAPWQPVWERVDELDAYYDMQKLVEAVNEHFSNVLGSVEVAISEAPLGSAIPREALRAKEQLLFQLYGASVDMGSVEVSTNFFRGQIESLGIGTFAKELAGRGTLTFSTDPPGAEVYCYRYEKSEEQLVPVQFQPSAGLEQLARGRVGDVFLKIESVWDAERSPFQPGDRWLRVGDRTPKTRGEFAAMLETVAVDSVVEVTVLRAGNELSLQWVPFPKNLYADKDFLEPGRAVDIYEQFGFTFAGYPLDVLPECRLGTTSGASPIEQEFPRGSYLLLIKKSGYVDTRVPISIPQDAGEREVRLLREDEVPPGFVYVPAGAFSYGGDEEAYNGGDRERPFVGGFLMKELEVTFGDYLKFVNDLHAKGKLQNEHLTVEFDWQKLNLHSAEFDPEEGVSIIPTARRVPQIQLKDQQYELTHLQPNAPLLGVSMVTGIAYANWLTKHYEGKWRFRLPTDQEWEKAARGVDGRTFVWCNYLILNFCLSRDGRHPRVDRRLLVDTFPLDESVYGVKDLAGCISEPVMARARTRDALIVYRGGSWSATDLRDFRAATRNRVLFYRNQRYIGLRLVAELPAKDD